MKQFSFFQPAMLPIEGVGYLQGGYSITVNIEEKNLDTGKNIYLSAVGNNISNISIGSGSISFWCKVFLDNDKKPLPLSNKNKNMMYLNKMEHYIGDINFFLEKKGLTTPIIILESGYIYSSYIGSASPIPSSMKRKIILTPFK